jgi:cytochrome oxidase Cu insertion factor (SCO1/SenC/PrrC family)
LVLGLSVLAATATAGAPPAPPIGKPAPSFTLALFSGQQVSLKDLAGKPVLINFWHSG